MSALWLEDPLGQRPLTDDDLPLSIGGPGAAVVVPACAPGEVLAEIVSLDSALGLKRAGAVPELLPEGRRIDIGQARLQIKHDAGRVWICIDHDGVANTTLPPLVDPRAALLGDWIPVPTIAYQPPLPGPRSRRVAFRWRRWATATAVLLVVAVIGFLLAATPVSVKTAPELQPESVEFSGGKLSVGLHGRHLLLPGDYQLELRAAGYEAVSAPVTIERGPEQRIDVALKRLPGVVMIDTQGIAATLSVDGVERGAVPGEFELAAGTRELSVQAARYAGKNIRLDVEGGGERQSLTIALEPLFAKVSISSLPEGAAVRIDGESQGVTPLVIELDAGRRALSLEHPQFRRFDSEVTVRAGEDLSIGPIELGMPDGNLLVRSEPAGADVSLGGRYRGRTPLKVPVPPGVPQEVVVNRAGYAPVTETVSVASRAERLLVYRLNAVLGEVQVQGEPSDATLYVDGASRGPANQVLTLPAAPHVFEIRKEGLVSHRVTVTPREGQPQRVAFSLMSGAEAALAKLPDRVTTALGQEMVLISGGRYTMGSPRREPGRRSNESERNVELRRPFYLAKWQVTNRDYRQFRKEHASGIFREETLDLDRQPVVRVSWDDAAAFCNWLSARDKLPPAYVSEGGRMKLARPVTRGYRLPSEAEWEFAARHDGKAASRKYPWGNSLPLPAKAGNWADATALYLTPVIISGYDDGQRVSATVGSYPANPLGLHDVGSNVFEWTTDYYSIYVVASSQYVEDPLGPEGGETHVVRGASWISGKVAELRTATRDAGSSGRHDLGFRVARYAE